jgi:hypothetical protein
MVFARCARSVSLTFSWPLFSICTWVRAETIAICDWRCGILDIVLKVPEKLFVYSHIERRNAGEQVTEK